MMTRTEKVNKYISLTLEENGETNIYIDGKKFGICKHLFVVNPQYDKEINEIESIDDLIELHNNNLHKHLTERIKKEDLGITDEQIFWGHLSNLQVWVESGYDTRLIDSKLAFPILRQLTQLGDEYAKMRYKEELIFRLSEGNRSTILYILDNSRFDNILEKEELEEIYAIIRKKIHELLDSLHSEDKSFIQDIMRYTDISYGLSHKEKLELVDKLNKIFKPRNF